MPVWLTRDEVSFLKNTRSPADSSEAEEMFDQRLLEEKPDAL